MTLPSIGLLHISVFQCITWPRSLQQGQKSNQGHTTTLHPNTPQPMSLPCINFLQHIQFPRFSPDKTLKVMVATARSRVKSRSKHDTAHLHPPSNVPAKYQRPILYGFGDIGWTRFPNSRSPWQGQR